MITFSIDGLPKNKINYLAMDYNSKIVYTAMCDPLFKYNKNSNMYICHASSEYKVKNKFKKYIVTLRDDLYYFNGKKVYPIDYKNVLNRVMKNNKILSVYFENIRDINCSDNKITFDLIRPDRNFINKLSLYQISPIGSGAFILGEVNKEEIQLYPNRYYRKNISTNLKYIIQTDENKHINDFLKNKIDITNNTLHPINYVDTTGYYNEEESFIIYNIEISSKIPIKTRKNIISCINKLKIVDILNNKSFATDTFSLNKYHLTKIKSNNFCYNKPIRIGYNKFYPNKLIAESIYNDLTEKKYNVKLVEYSYEKSDENNLKKYDINLVLNYFEFYDPIFFYESLYFKTIMKSNRMYRVLVDWYQKKNSTIVLNNIYKMFRKKFLKEPLVIIKSRYLTNNKAKGFSFLELNYDIFENQKGENHD